MTELGPPSPSTPERDPFAPPPPVGGSWRTSAPAWASSPPGQAGAAPAAWPAPPPASPYAPPPELPYAPPPGSAYAPPPGPSYAPTYAAPYGSPPVPGGEAWAGWAPPGGRPERTNPWSVVALVTGLVGLVPVAVGAGVVALVQLRRRPGGGRGLAIGGLAASGCWTALALFAAVLLFVGQATGSGLFGGTSGYDPQDSVVGTVARSGGAPVGACLSSSSGATDAQVSCTAPHDREVYLRQALTGDAWPGEDDVAGRADDLCYGAFDGAMGQSYEDSPDEYGAYVPDQDEWAQGERTVVCVLVPADGRLFTSLHSGRRS